MPRRAPHDQAQPASPPFTANDVANAARWPVRPRPAVERHCLVERCLGVVGPDHEVGPAVERLAVDELVEPQQPRQVGRVRVVGDAVQRRVALQPQADLLERRPVDRDRGFDPVLVAGLLVAVDHRGHRLLVDLDRDVVERVGVPDPGAVGDLDGGRGHAAGGHPLGAVGAEGEAGSTTQREHGDGGGDCGTATCHAARLMASPVARLDGGCDQAVGRVRTSHASPRKGSTSGR